VSPWLIRADTRTLTLAIQLINPTVPELKHATRVVAGIHTLRRRRRRRPFSVNGAFWAFFGFGGGEAAAGMHVALLDSDRMGRDSFD
jgi:hypothetical protein